MRVRLSKNGGHFAGFRICSICPCSFAVRHGLCRRTAPANPCLSGPFPSHPFCRGFRRCRSLVVQPRGDLRVVPHPPGDVHLMDLVDCLIQVDQIVYRLYQQLAVLGYLLLVLR